MSYITIFELDFFFLISALLFTVNYILTEVSLASSSMPPFPYYFLVIEYIIIEVLLCAKQLWVFQLHAYYNLAQFYQNF